MRARLAIIAIGLLMLAGCATQEPKLSIEPSVLDSIPVVPLVTKLGVSTAWLNEDSSLVTTSHGFPRGELSGPAEIENRAVNYVVTASGDGLKRSWSVWNATNSSMGQSEDWAKVAITPPLTQKSLFSAPATLVWGTSPPALGEQLVLVGYTRESDGLQRYWVQVTVIEVPSECRELDAGHHVWFRTLNGTKLRNGFSGAPLLRQRNDGVFEAIAMMVSAGKRSDKPLDIGVAIVVPKN